MPSRLSLGVFAFLPSECQPLPSHCHITIIITAIIISLRYRYHYHHLFHSLSLEDTSLTSSSSYQMNPMEAGREGIGSSVSILSVLYARVTPIITHLPSEQHGTSSQRGGEGGDVMVFGQPASSLPLPQPPKPPAFPPPGSCPDPLMLKRGGKEAA